MTVKLECVAEQLVSPPQVNDANSTTSISGKTGQWSPDGTCLIQVQPNNTLETVILPEDLLDTDRQTKHILTPYSHFKSADPIYSTAVYPQFTLANPQTTLVLTAARDTPIQLRNALNYDQGIYATYSWTDTNTEAVITPHCMQFTAEGTHFVTGAKARFAIWDVNNPQTGPVGGRRRGARKFGRGGNENMGMGSGSLISAMDIHHGEDKLALGTSRCEVAIYADHGLGDLVTSFRLPPGPGEGNGISQVKWSPDGTYLFVAPRNSDTVECYDMRHAKERLSWCSGRNARVQFAMGVDVVQTLEGLEVWGGGVDGCVRVWVGPEQRMGEVEVSESIKVHDNPVCATMVHASDSVLATLALKDRRAAGKTNDSANMDNSSSESPSSDDSDAEDESDSSSDSTDASDGEEPHVLPQPSIASEDSEPMLKIWAIH